MSPVLEKIIEEVRTLPQEEQRLLRELLDREQHDAERARRAALSRQVRGKFAHLPTSSDEFARRKAEEIEREDRKGQA